MGLICGYCGRDLNEIWQDNMSPIPFKVICEDCSANIRKAVYHVSNYCPEIRDVNKIKACPTCGKNHE